MINDGLSDAISLLDQSENIMNYFWDNFQNLDPQNEYINCVEALIKIKLMKISF